MQSVSAEFQLQGEGGRDGWMAWERFGRVRNSKHQHGTPVPRWMTWNGRLAEMFADATFRECGVDGPPPSEARPGRVVVVVSCVLGCRHFPKCRPSFPGLAGWLASGAPDWGAALAPLSGERTQLV